MVRFVIFTCLFLPCFGLFNFSENGLKKFPRFPKANISQPFWPFMPFVAKIPSLEEYLNNLDFAVKCRGNDLVKGNVIIMPNDTANIARDEFYINTYNKKCFLQCLTYELMWINLHGKFDMKILKRHLSSTTLSPNGVNEILKKCVNPIVDRKKLCERSYSFVNCIWQESKNSSLHSVAPAKMMQPVCLLVDNIIWNACFDPSFFKQLRENSNNWERTIEYYDFSNPELLKTLCLFTDFKKGGTFREYGNSNGLRLVTTICVKSSPPSLLGLDLK